MNKFISGLMILGLLSLTVAPSFAANEGADVNDNKPKIINPEKNLFIFNSSYLPVNLFRV